MPFLVHQPFKYYTVSQTNSYLSSRGIVCPQHKNQAIEDVKDNKIYITLENNSNSCIKIKKNAIIAKITYIQEEKNFSAVLQTKILDEDRKG